MTRSDAWVIAAGLGFATLIGAGPSLMLWAAARGTPAGICKRLERGKTVRIRTSYTLGGTWNPARPSGPRNWTRPVPGSATYRLTPDQLVVLDLVTADGHHDRFVGPPVKRPTDHDRTSRVARALVLVPAAGAILGALIGYLVAGTSRFEGAAAGAAAGALLGALASAPIMTIARAIADRRRHRPR